MSAAALKSVPDIPVVPPGEDELPYDFGPPMESDVHLFQMNMLIEVLRLYFANRPDVYVGGNMAIYYSDLQVKRNDFRGPDFFVVLDTTNRKRKSWVVWQEERTPDLVIELLSESTERVDRGEKMKIYARSMHVPEYYLYDPLDERLEAYRLDPRTTTYFRVQPDERGDFTSEILGLRLGVRDGVYQNMDGPWLRWMLPSGEALPTAVERATREAERAAREAERATREAERAASLEAERDQLLALLRAQGIDPARG